MDIAQVIVSQYQAALAMLEDAVVRCPDDLWDTPQPPNRFYQIAYHALFYTHLYLQPTVDDFKVWEKHIDGHQSFGQPPYPGAPAPCCRRSLRQAGHPGVRRILPERGSQYRTDA